MPNLIKFTFIVSLLAIMANLLACTAVTTTPTTIKVPPKVQSPPLAPSAPTMPREVLRPSPAVQNNIQGVTLPKTKRPNASGYLATGNASWSGLANHGMKTASGEIYDLYGMTAAHATLPLLARVRVKNLRTGKIVMVTINDRVDKSSSSNLLIKLSYHAARQLGLLKSVSAVEVRGLAGDR